jgi:hypothetical protein
MLDTGCWILDAGYSILDAGFWIADKIRLKDKGSRLKANGIISRYALCSMPYAPFTSLNFSTFLTLLPSHLPPFLSSYFLTF